MTVPVSEMKCVYCGEKIGDEFFQCENGEARDNLMHSRCFRLTPEGIAYHTAIGRDGEMA